MKHLRTKLVDKLQLELFMAAHQRASRGKANREEVLRFNLDLTGNLLRMMDNIGSGRYQPSPYRCFTVHEPKVRQILALPYPDRIVHQWAVEEFYLPYFVPRFIPDSYACITGRGTHAAVNRAQQFMRSMHSKYGDNYYILKMDISKFFNSIDQQTLFDILSRHIVDPALLNLTHAFIFHDHNLKVGIPIGNYTSQQFANIYLHELDKFCKHNLNVKYYIRYMDDFILMVPTKTEARQLFTVIEQFIIDRLKLCLNPKSHYYPAKFGLNFAGYRIFNDYRLLRRRSKVKLKKIISDYELGIDNEERFIRRVNSWYGHAQHADSYRFCQCRLARYQKQLPIIFKSDN